MARLRIPLSEFWNYVNQTETCWLWKGSMYPNGYGSFKHHQKAHRVAFEICHGPIPSGLWVLHKCDNPPCVRPDHLFLGTPSDNARDMIKKNRHGKGAARGESHRSHKLTAAQVLNIRSSEQAPLALAQVYSVTRRTIYQILERSTWKHI